MHGSAAQQLDVPQRLTGRNWVGDLKTRARIALRDSFLRRAVPVSQDKMRFKRDDVVEEYGAQAFQELREHGRRIRRHVIEHLDYYLEQLAARVQENGGHVFFALTAEEAREYVLQVARKHQVKTVIKSKSMVSEELELNEALLREGIRPVETDLGEYIVQLAGHAPSHIVGPALHMSREEIAELFSKEAGRPLPADSQALTAFARERLREEFLSADMGITGCNFAVAENGAIVLVTNEGNGRMVTSLPPVLVTLMGMERLVPTMADLDVMLDLLPRSATGQKASVYNTITLGTRSPGDPDGPQEFHLVIVDNGRSNLIGGEFQDALNCIRCGACLNVCPVYRQIGGHAYGWVYAGPIGAVLTPLYQGFEKFGELPLASSLCGACSEACPVKIPLHDFLIGLRVENLKRRGAPFWERLTFRLWAAVMTDARRYSWAQRIGRLLQSPWARSGRISHGPGPLAHWTKARDFPPIAGRTFRERWQEWQRHQVPPVPAPGREVPNGQGDVSARN